VGYVEQEVCNEEPVTRAMLKPDVVGEAIETKQSYMSSRRKNSLIAELIEPRYCQLEANNKQSGAAVSAVLTFS
jgi:hypothetical protein